MAEADEVGGAAKEDVEGVVGQVAGGFKRVFRLWRKEGKGNGLFTSLISARWWWWCWSDARRAC